MTISPWDGERARTIFIACCTFAILYSIYCWSPLARAGWSIIDDHEIVGTIGNRPRLPMTELPNAIGQTEVAATSANRYRPVYYFTRVLEMATWGKLPQPWFALRMALAIASAFLLASISFHLAGPILGFGFVIFELFQTYWADIYTRLGPSEGFAMFGSCLAVSQLMPRQPDWDRRRCLLIAAGVVLAIGGKENFIFMAVVPAWLLWTKWHTLPTVAKVGFSAVLAFALWIVVVVVRGVAKAGQDVYANDVSAVGRFRLLAGFLGRHDVQIWLVACVALFLLWYWLRTAERNPNVAVQSQSRDVFNVGCLLAGLLIIYASQYVFYSGKWPEKALGRYLVPGLVAAHVAILVGLAALARFVDYYAPRWTTVAHVVGALLMVGSVAHKWNGNRSRAVDTANTTAAFTKKVADAATYLKAHPEMMIVINSHSVVDYEPVQALPRFLRAAGVDNKIALRIDGYSSNSPAAAGSALVFQLARQLEDQRDRGSKEFQPLNSVDKVPGCFSFGLSGAPAARCVKGDRVWR